MALVVITATNEEVLNASVQYKRLTRPASLNLKS